MGGFRSRYFFISIGFVFIKIARNYFPLLSVNLLSVTLKLHMNISTLIIFLSFMNT